MCFIRVADIDFIANENWYPVKKRIFDECKKYMKKEFNVDIEDKNIRSAPLDENLKRELKREEQAVALA